MSKVIDLESAVSVVEDGCHLALTGFAITRNSISAVHELLRIGPRHLTLTQVIGGMDTDLLVGSGCVDHLNYSGGSLDRFGPLHSVNRAIADKAITVHEYSSLSLTLRLHAAALGLPFVAALPMLGSQLLEQLAETDGVKTGTDPFTHRPVVLLSSLRPDVAIVHVDEADQCGNAIVNGPLWSLRESVLAADKVVITCENLVEEGALDPDRITIPGEVVTAVALAPRGAHPTAVFRTYDYDRDHLTMYAAASQAGGEELDRYLRFVVGLDERAHRLPGTRGVLA